MTNNFDLLIDEYKNGLTDSEGLGAKLYKLLTEDQSVNITSLLERIQQLFIEEKINEEQYRVFSETLTQQNIKLTLDKKATETNTKSAITDDSDWLLDDTVFRAEKTEIDNQYYSDKTVVLPGNTKRRKQSKGETSSKPITLGSTLKNRFILTEVIGKGGMGYVYKARDLVKVQAQDKNPYVAIKVLSKKFKKYSTAFIALQRETSKSQRLAHPNIATAYDFDYDGDMVYMTMELMHGKPLDKFLRSIPKGGLPLTHALHYIEQICNALAYAHKQKLIHSDLKPANIFVNDSGRVKLLDFGITRVIKSKSDADDKTLFDPSSLNALTPAYATIEMFNGDDPDPRDDIYALACVAYELLTGMHPFRKVPANKAQELDLKPPIIKKISRRQQKALNFALKFKRADRTQSVEQFLSGFMAPKSHIKELMAAVFVVIVIGVALLANPIRKQMEGEAQLELIQSIKSGNKSNLIELLDTINSKETNTRITLISILRKEIINYYQDQINDAINAKERRYNFPQAFKLLDQVRVLYPDSASLVEAERQLLDNKKRLLETLISKYQQIQTSGGDTARVISIIKEADPDNPLVSK